MYLRNAIGIVGIIMPLWILYGAYIRENIWQLNSISAYYYTSMRDVFVACLMLVGGLLACYRGTEFKDNLAAFVAGISAMFIGLFPMAPEFSKIVQEKYACFNRNDCYFAFGILGFHFLFVALFFVIIFWMVYFRFKIITDQKELTSQKIKRNKIYKICGGIMFCSYVLIAYMYFTNNQYIFWPEYSAIFSFAYAWLTKGQALHYDTDKKPRIYTKIQGLNVKKLNK